MVFELPKLPYEYDALEPYIDTKTMEIHHSKHHAGYTKKLNAALEKHPELFEKKAEDLISDLESVPEDIRIAVKNNGGGYINHNLFWNCLTGEKQEPSSKILEMINETFGSVDEFKKKFSEAALTRFGSGWAWLVSYGNEQLEIVSTGNQDSPLSEGKVPILCLDVWEHSYYLLYQNRRDEYIEAFWNVVNWKKVDELYEGIVG